jgi:peptidoglycan biosynthesis protein MviN/MurJ (putative lipid II flippase)
VNLLFFRSFGFRSVALGTSLGAWVNAAILSLGLRRRLRTPESEAPDGGFGRMILASLGMAAAAWGTSTVVESWLGHKGLGAQLATGLIPVTAGVLVYGALALVLRIPEASLLRSAVARIRRTG